MSERGKYIVFEGGEFSGKSTQLDMTKSDISRSGFDDAFLYTREPGGTPVGEDIRKILFFPNPAYFPDKELPDAVALQLFTANRLYNWHNQILPALEEGINVISDRNWFSTLAYQGARGLISEEEIIETTVRSLPKAYTVPDLALVLEIPREERIRRQGLTALQDGESVDAFEAQDNTFHDKTAEIYRHITLTMGAVAIDGARPKNIVHSDIVTHIEQSTGLDLAA